MNRPSNGAWLGRRATALARAPHHGENPVAAESSKYGKDNSSVLNDAYSTLRASGTITSSRVLSDSHKAQAGQQPGK